VVAAVVVVERGETALLSALTPGERRTLADLLRKLVLEAETPAGGSPAPYGADDTGRR
jgi:hypothetical protein